MHDSFSREHIEEVAHSIASLPPEEREERECLALAHMLSEATGLEIEPGDFNEPME